MTRADRYPLVLLGLFTVFWVLLAIAPWYRQDWLLENLLVFVAVPVLVLTARSLRFSNFAYTCLFAFFVLHEIGAHYTYSEVPWRDWLQALGVEGVALHRPQSLRPSRPPQLWLADAACDLGTLPAACDAHPHLALHPAGDVPHGAFGDLRDSSNGPPPRLFGGDLGEAYLGTQGDTWDAQKDMALASLGAVLGLAMMVVRERLQPARRS